jgi:hypothetical protein
MESCMMRALVDMSVDPSTIPMRSSKPFSGGERMEHSREPLGIVQALGPLVALGPITLIAAGVTVGVYIAVAVTEEAIEAAKRRRNEEERCKQVKHECIVYCSDTTLPTPDFGWKFQKCKNECLERNGCPRDS